LKLASGRYILFLDDDAWHPDLLIQLIDRIEIKEGKLCYSNCSVVEENRSHPQPTFISETIPIRMHTRQNLPDLAAPKAIF
jgi:glycosyltransferase involved in cell wall biosynthesis